MSSITVMEAKESKRLRGRPEGGWGGKGVRLFF